MRIFGVFAMNVVGTRACPLLFRRGGPADGLVLGARGRGGTGVDVCLLWGREVGGGGGSGRDKEGAALVFGSGGLLARRGGMMLHFVAEIAPFLVRISFLFVNGECLLCACLYSVLTNQCCLRGIGVS